MAEISGYVVLQLPKALRDKTKTKHAAFKSDDLRNIKHKRGKIASKLWACAIKSLKLDKEKKS